MIDYDSFHSYLVELVGLYQRAHTTKGMSDLARRHHCAGLTRDQFYQMKLDKLTPEQVTPQLSRVIRDTIGRSDAKAVLRESIGALNEGILAGSRVSQGSDRTVQITITQPVAPAADCHLQPLKQKQQNGFPGKLPVYRPGQIVLHKETGEMFLVSRLLDGDRFTYRYVLGSPKYAKQIVSDAEETGSFWMGNGAIRPAKGNEVARFLGALTRSGYEWTADNANGLFSVLPKKTDATKVEVFANDLPEGFTSIFPLPAMQPSPYRFAMQVDGKVANAADFMADRFSTSPVLTNAVLRQIQSFHKVDGLKEYREYQLPTLCCSDIMKEHTVGFVRVSFNDMAYWLARDRDVLRLLAWISFIND